VLVLSEQLAEKIRSYAAATYPHECCGALLGTERGHAREVRELCPLQNLRDDSPRNRFAISANDFRAAERAGRERGLEVIGWYHSHPDHPALPSEYDREHAWPWYSYLITSITAGRPGEMKSWRLADDRARFEAEPIETRAGAAH